MRSLVVNQTVLLPALLLGSGAAHNNDYKYIVWPDSSHLFNGSQAFPFERSEAYNTFEFAQSGAIDSGGLTSIGADTWYALFHIVAPVLWATDRCASRRYPSWSVDGDLYSTFTDGIVSPGRVPAGGKAGIDTIQQHALSCGPCVRSPYPKHVQHNNGSFTTTGHARVVGSDVTNLTVTDVNTFASSALPYQGRYPCANFVYNDTWYYGTYGIADYWGRAPRKGGAAGWNCGEP